jgi:hypothetical protein
VTDKRQWLYRIAIQENFNVGGFWPHEWPTNSKKIGRFADWDWWISFERF